jgi:flagellar protein FliO/FliZ
MGDDVCDVPFGTGKSVQTHSLVLAGLALCLVLSFIGLIQIGLTRLRGRGMLAAFLPRAGGMRLRVVEALGVDTRRRVLLLACDDREVWVLTGGPNDLVLGAWPAPEERTP